MALHAVQGAVGCRVCVHNLRSRPELNRLAGTVTSVDEAKGRLGVRLDGQGAPISVSCQHLKREDSPPWDKCRHGGPLPDPAMMQEFFALFTAANQLTAPCLEHVQLLEPHIRRYSPPPILFASTGIDAYIEMDYSNCRGFAVCAIVLQGVREEGHRRFFASVAARLGGGVSSPVLATVEAQLARCKTATGLLEVLDSFAKCPKAVAGGREWSCLQIAAHRGVGLSQSHIDPAPSPVDAIYERGAHPPPQRTACSAAALAGENLARLALQSLESGHSSSTSTREKALAIRAAAGALLGLRSDATHSGERRAEVRELMLRYYEAAEVAGGFFIDGGGMPRLEASVTRCLTVGGRQLRADTPLGDEALLAFEIIKEVQSTAVASALLRGGIAARLCHFMSTEHDLVLDHNALSALCSILGAAETTEFVSALGHAALAPVVRLAAILMHDLLTEDVLDFSMLDVLLRVATLIAGGSAELAHLVASTSVRGIPYCIPTSLLLILVQHAHEQRAGRTDGPKAGACLNGLAHLPPISMALTGLYTISLHFDLRVVALSNSGSFVDALGEYASFLHGFVHHQAVDPIAQECLARLRQFTASSAPPMNPCPLPVETEVEQTRRLRQYARSLHEVRGRVREQRHEQRTRGVGPAVERADDARQRGNRLIESSRWHEAADAYSEAVAALTGLFEGLEMDAHAAWSLVLALSNRAEAFLKMGRHEAVLDDCTNAWVLLERHEGGFDAAKAEAIGVKLARREAAAEAQQRGAARADAARQAAAERGQARTERRRRAREARVLRRALETAPISRGSSAAAGARDGAEAESASAEATSEARAVGVGTTSEVEGAADEPYTVLRALQAAKTSSELRTALIAAMTAEREAPLASEASEIAEALPRARQRLKELKLKEDAEAKAAAAEAAVVAAAPAMSVAELSEPECRICLEGRDEGALEDVCGHGHLLHLGCAAVWRERCLKQQREAMERGVADHLGPHCPTCRRSI